MTMWRLKYIKLGGHVHCTLFAGPQEGALGKCGDITFRECEFTEFTRLRKVLAMDFVCTGDSSTGQCDVKFDPVT